MTKAQAESNSQSAQTSVSLIIAPLATLEPPPDKSVWVGPFDQLVSSGHALLVSARRSFETRNVSDYHGRVLSNVVRLLQSDSYDTDPSLNDYLLGFYFNAGFQRIVWAAERLLTTFAAVNCSCGDNSYAITRHAKNDQWPHMKAVIPAVMKHLQHAHFNAKLLSFRALFDQMKEDNTFTCEQEKALRIFADEVNLRKHSVYDVAFLQRTRPKHADGTSWKPSDQLELAIYSFKLACCAYGELVRWNPNLRLA